MDALILMAVLPPAPTVNGLYHPKMRSSGTLGIYKDASAITYEQQVALLLACPTRPWRVYQAPERVLEPIRRDHTSFFDFIVWEWFRHNAMDIDNPIKALQDAVFRSLEIDDKRIINLHVHKRFHPECTPCKMVVVRTASQPDLQAEQDRLDRYMQCMSYPPEVESYDGYTNTHRL